MNLRSVLKHRNAIYGLCALWIVCFHSSLSCVFPTKSWTISHFVKGTLKQSDVTVNGILKGFSQFLSSGNLGVDIFMILSGLCLYLSFDRRYGDGKIDFLGYIKKRVVRVAIPYLVISLPYWIWESIVKTGDKAFDIKYFFINYSSISFWFGNSRKAWFVFAILSFYVIFPLIYKAVRKSSLLGLAVLAVAFVGGYFICKSPAENIAIAIARLPSFVVGVLAGKHIDDIDLKCLPEAVRGILVAFSLGIVLLGTAFFPVHKVVSKNHLPAYAVWYTYSILAIFAMIFLMWLCGKVQRFYFEKTLNFVGGLSLEIYLVHTLTYHVLGFYKLKKVLGVKIFLVLLFVGIVGAFLFSLIVKLILLPYDRKEKRLNNSK